MRLFLLPTLIFDFGFFLNDFFRGNNIFNGIFQVLFLLTRYLLLLWWCRVRFV
jgi:hypothetical protein